MTTHPARLFVLLAREAPVAVIFRRGPTQWVQMILWDTKRDIFTPGQWLHGRIFVERCDLSPDGKLLIYFASKYSAKTLLENKFAWTAISKPPYFTALDIRFQTDTWGGGGIFETRDKWSLWTSQQSLQHLLITAGTEANLVPLTIDRVRRYLDGWINIGVDEHSKATNRPRYKWQKSVGHYLLVYFESAHTKNPHYTNCYTLKRGNNDIEISLGGVLWADFDYKGRLVLAKDGKIFSATLHNAELKLTELADFNANKLNPQPAPDWAQKW